MTHEEFMNLEVENIKEEVGRILNFINMWFDIKECEYCMQVCLEDEKYVITVFGHHKQGKTCQLCGDNNRGICHSLEPYKEDLFRRLVYSKELRLKWVTMRPFNWD